MMCKKMDIELLLKLEDLFKSMLDNIFNVLPNNVDKLDLLKLFSNVIEFRRIEIESKKDDVKK